MILNPVSETEQLRARVKHLENLCQTHLHTIFALESQRERIGQQVQQVKDSFDELKAAYDMYVAGRQASIWRMARAITVIQLEIMYGGHTEQGKKTLQYLLDILQREDSEQIALEAGDDLRKRMMEAE